MCSPRRFPLARWLAVLAVGLGVPGAARAGELDPASGRLGFAPGSYAVSFDDPVSLSDLAPAFFDHEETPLDASALADQVRADGAGLEGEGYLELGGEYAKLQLFPASLAPRFTGRRVEIRFWQRPEGTRLRATLTWVQPDAEVPERQRLLGHFVFQPTGRATDDGWEEWTSGPVDFAAAGVAPLALIELEDVTLARSGITFDRHQRVRLDALEVLDLGPAAVPEASCTRLAQAQACGPFGACLLGRCVDAALRFGPALVDPALRSDYLDRRLFEFRAFEGGRMPQSLVGGLTEAVETLRNETSAARFWPRIKEGVAALRDGHASAPMLGVGPNYEVTNLGVCVHYGEADLLPHGGPAPLIFSVEAENPIADQLAVGDVLTAIDGLPPYDWAVTAGLTANHGGDPAAFEVVIAPGLLAAAQLAGSVVTFARCAASGAPCAPGEVETITVDYGALAEETVWAGRVPEWLGHSQTCDYRFRRGVDHPDVRSYSFAGYADDGPVRTLIINGVPSLYYGQDWANTVRAALDPPPAYLILDQRTGHGGGVDTTDFFMGLFLPQQDFDHIEIVPQVDRTLDATAWETLGGCHLQVDSNDCGGYWRWQFYEMGDVEPALRGVAATTRVAVVNSLDVSGNDFTSRLFTHRSGPTRIFGPSPTFGAFGPIAGLPAHLDELHGGSMQFWDSVFVTHPQDAPGGFATGVGVPPDQLVLQRQSDALLGVDTALEAARAWLLQE